MVKKLKKDIKNIAGVSLLGGAAGIGISALGGNATPISNATRFLPAIGTVAGAGAMIRTVDKFGKVTMKRRKRR